MRFLKLQRLSGCEDYFTVREIAEAVNGNIGGGAFWAQVNQLYAFGYLEVMSESWNRRKFRIKLEYVLEGDVI